MASKAILVSKPCADELLLKQKLHDSGEFEVDSVHSASETTDLLKSKNYDLCIFNFNRFRKSQYDLALKMRNLGYKFPIMATANEIDFSELPNEVFQELLILEKPFHEKDLIGVSKKLIQGKKVDQRIHRRYPTNQIAKVELVTEGSLHDSHMFNLSKGGAYIELPQDLKLDEGDLLRLDIHLAQIDKKHDLHAKVVWTNKQARWNMGQSVGVEFISPDDIYSTLLDSF